MSSWKRKIARLAEKLSGTVITHPAEIHQLPERVLLRRFFADFEVDCVFDVGANKGQYARQLRDDIGFQGHIVSFEPIPYVYVDLAKRASTDPKWHVARQALDREAGPAIFNVMASDVFSSLHRPAEDQPSRFSQTNTISTSIEVTRATLATEYVRWRDELGFKRPFLKMDTQGNDLAVFEGAGDMIAHFVGLQSELSYRPLYAGIPGFAETLQAYEARGFRLTGLVPSNAGHFPDLHEIDCIMYRTDAALRLAGPSA